MAANGQLGASCSGENKRILKEIVMETSGSELDDSDNDPDYVVRDDETSKKVFFVIFF